MKTDLEILREMVERKGFYDTLESLSIICYEKYEATEEGTEDAAKWFHIMGMVSLALAGIDLGDGARQRNESLEVVRRAAAFMGVLKVTNFAIPETRNIDHDIDHELDDPRLGQAEENNRKGVI